MRENVETESAKRLGGVCEFKGADRAVRPGHYGHGFKPKIIWLFVTENIIWSRPDRERAAGEHIRIITERELRYYSQVAE